MCYLDKICDRVRAKVCQKFSIFSETRDIERVQINNGLITITSPLQHGQTDLVGGDVIVISNSGINYNTHSLAKGWIDTSHILTSNDLEFPLSLGYINVDTYPVNGLLHFNIRTLVVTSREIALDIFKNKPTNHIFIIEDYSKYSGVDVLEIERNFKIMIYLYNKNDRLQHNNLKIVKEIERLLLIELQNFKLDDNYDDILPIGSQFTITTNNTLVLEIDFKIFERLVCEDGKSNDDLGYRLNYQNPNLEEIVMEDREVKHGCNVN